MKRFLSLFLSFVLLLSSSWFGGAARVRAADDSLSIIQAQLQLTNDANGNNIANIADQITISVGINNTDGGCVAQNTQVILNLLAYGGSNAQAVACAVDNGGVNDVFVFQHNILNAANGIDVGANNPASQISVTALDADENNGAGNPDPQQQTNALGDGVVDTVATGGVDSIAPLVTDAGIAATIAVDDGVVGVAGINDQILVTYTPLTDGINEPDPNEIRANLTAIGGLGNQQLVDDGTNGDEVNGDGTFSFALTIAAGAIDATGLAVGVVLQDDAGNNSGAPVNDGNTFSVDNVPPIVTDGAIMSVLQVDQNINGIANVQDVIRTSWDNSAGGDNNPDGLSAVTADLSAVGGPAAQQLFDDGTNGDQVNGDGIFTFELTVAGGSINDTNLNASVSVTDDGGNLVTVVDTSSNLSVSNVVGGGGVRRSTRFGSPQAVDEVSDVQDSSDEGDDMILLDMVDEEEFLDLGSGETDEVSVEPLEQIQRPLNARSLLSAEDQVRALTFARDFLGHPRERFILELYRKGIVHGVNGEMSFQAGATLTRAELLKVVLRAFDVPVVAADNETPFSDVGEGDWFAPYFSAAYRAGIIRGLPDGTAHPEQPVSRIEALTMLFRAAGIDPAVAAEYPLSARDFFPREWWADTARFAYMNGLIQVTADGWMGSETAITRGEMAELTSLAMRLKAQEPCNCDPEKMAWEEAEKKAGETQKTADDAQQAADEKQVAADEAQKKADEARKKVQDLEAFFDDSSFVEVDGERITRSDLALLKAASAEIYAGYVSGDKTAQETSEAWRENNKDKLDELRAEKAEELKQAQEEYAKADANAKAAQKAADEARRDADARQKEADEARSKADMAKRAYDDCQKKCKELKIKIAEENRKREEARRRADEKARREADAKARAEAREQAEAERRAREESAPPPVSAGGSDGMDEDDGGEVPPAAKGPCEEKLAQAMAARGRQIAKSRPDDVPDPPAAGQTPGTIVESVGNGIANAAQAAASGAGTAAQIASAASSLVGTAYGLWVNYVGDQIKAAGMRVIANRRICNYVKYSTTGVCGYEELGPGQVVYWEKGADGRYHVIVMGPGDTVTEGACE